MCFIFIPCVKVDMFRIRGHFRAVMCYSLAVRSCPVLPKCASLTAGGSESEVCVRKSRTLADSPHPLLGISLRPRHEILSHHRGWGRRPPSSALLPSIERSCHVGLTSPKTLHRGGFHDVQIDNRFICSTFETLDIPVTVSLVSVD